MELSRSTSVSRMISAPCEMIYRAFLSGDAVATWLPPGNMTGVVHAFDAREGGAFSMSLVYPEQDSGRGKTASRTDTFKGRFAELVPDQKMVWVTQFEADDPAFAGEMTITTTFKREGEGTQVTMACENIPVGIRLEDNEEGSRLTLAQLASFVEGY